MLFAVQHPYLPVHSTRIHSNWEIDPFYSIYIKNPYIQFIYQRIFHRMNKQLDSLEQIKRKQDSSIKRLVQDIQDIQENQEEI